MKKLLTCLFLVTIILSCKSRKEKPNNPEADFFPVTDYLKGEVRKLDSSLASILKIETIEGRTDTVSISREQARAYAKDFLSLPDISKPELKDDYEITKLYDDYLQAFVFSYLTKEEEHEIKRQEVILEPNMEGNADIRSALIVLWKDENDSSVRKNLFWESGKRFTIATIVDKPNQEQKISKLEVVWNNFEGVEN